ncbi:MAG: histidine kinase dimerization/phosphoacceptor domain-containing protein [Umezawaea sp.]
MGGLVTWSAVAVVVGPLVLAARCTVRTALVGMSGVLFAGAGIAVMSGVSLRLAAGGCLVVAGVVTAIWALGRWCRRWWVVRSATAAHRAAAAGIPEVAAAVERERLTAVLHDVAAHRLTSIVVSAGAAARLSDPDLTAQAIRHAVIEGRRSSPSWTGSPRRTGRRSPWPRSTGSRRASPVSTSAGRSTARRRTWSSWCTGWCWKR